MGKNVDLNLDFWRAARDFAFWAEKACNANSRAYNLAHAARVDLVNAAEKWYQAEPETAPKPVVSGVTTPYCL